ncbi:hypothetical protein [Methanogenium cariaci]|nr:hypothetical protein [Methanogenium cariaci]
MCLVRDIQFFFATTRVATNASAKTMAMPAKTAKISPAFPPSSPVE